MTDETTEVQVILGPYRDSRLTMSTADAQSAINNHRAVDPFAPLDDHPHDPLTEQERQDAYEASMTWAKTQWGVPPPEPPPPEGGEGDITRKRAMKPEEGVGYKTRQAEPTAPQQRAGHSEPNR